MVWVSMKQGVCVCGLDPDDAAGMAADRGRRLVGDVGK
jgi:hypothetical protein